MGPRFGMDSVEKRKSLLLRRESHSNSPARSPRLYRLSYPKFSYSPLFGIKKAGFKYCAEVVTIAPHNKENMTCLSEALSFYCQSQIYMALSIVTR
jgi:hypothetical protein